MNSLKEIVKIIKKSKSIAIFTHINPDFDALGSSYALFYALKEIGKNVEFYTREKLNSHQKLIFEDDAKHNICDENNFDLFICVDVSTLNRLGDYAYIFKNIENNTIVLDHHICTELIANYNYINHKKSSCSELILDLLTALKIKINPLIASFMYAGVSSDTSSFMNSNTNLNSYKAATKLVELGADVNKINESLYETRTLKEITFKKYLWNNFKIYKDTAYCLVDNKALTELKGKKADCDSFSRSLVSIENVNRSFSLIEEKIGIFNLSMRSKVGYDVRIIAERLGGGGHVCAAGAKFEAKNMQMAKKMVLDALFMEEE